MSWLPTCSNCRPALNNARESAHKSPKCEDAAAIEGSVLLSSKVGIHNANFCPNSTMHINQRLWGRWKKKTLLQFSTAFCGEKLITTVRSFLVKNGHLSHPFSWEGRVEIHKKDFSKLLLIIKAQLEAISHSLQKPLWPSVKSLKTHDLRAVWYVKIRKKGGVK